jgi:uncharacterized protein with FMN-binding domain
MRRIVTWALGTITTLVLLFSYHTSTSSAPATVQASGAKAGTGSGVVVGGSASDAPANGGSGVVVGASGTYAGNAVGTRFGNVQVQITVANGKISAATVLQVPNRDMRDIQINGYAVPILNEEVVAAQSAQIDMVSGATVTSVAYLQSLQSAIDQAHL